jgi:hypothetical protein
MTERRTLEERLSALEALLERLAAGEPVPNATIAESVEALREGASRGENPNGYVPPTDPALLRLRQMFWALESLERGESGAAGHFVRNGREYVRLVRHSMYDCASGETVR